MLELSGYLVILLLSILFVVGVIVLGQLGIDHSKRKSKPVSGEGGKGTNMITKFGQLMRGYRLNKRILLYDMASELNISCSELSGYETGKQVIPNELMIKVFDYLELNDLQKEGLLNADKLKPVIRKHNSNYFGLLKTTYY